MNDQSVNRLFKGALLTLIATIEEIKQIELCKRSINHVVLKFTKIN